MDLTDVEELPRLISHDSEIVVFIPVASFGFLYLINPIPVYFIMFIVGTVASTVVFQEVSGLPGTSDVTISDRVLSPSALLLLLSYFISIALLFNELSIVSGTIVIEEAINFAMIFINLATITSAIIKMQFREPEIRDR